MDRATIPPVTSLELHAGCRFVGRSDVGRSRAENQDFMGVFRLPERVLAVVADGMGGHSGGYEASRVAVDACRQAFVRDPDAAPAEVLRRALELAHQRVREVAAGAPALQGMGTTLVAVLVSGGAAWVAHVGDSRAYLLRAAHPTLLTLDHSRVHRMLLEGMIRADQVADHPMGHILERSVGAAESFQPEVRADAVPLQRGDRLVLCSDGVWSVLSDDDLGALAANPQLPLAAEGALGAALARATDDNATVVIVEVGEGVATAPAIADVRAPHGLAPRGRTAAHGPSLPPPPAGLGALPPWAALAVGVLVGALTSGALVASCGGTPDPTMAEAPTRSTRPSPPGDEVQARSEELRPDGPQAAPAAAVPPRGEAPGAAPTEPSSAAPPEPPAGGHAPSPSTEPAPDASR